MGDGDQTSTVDGGGGRRAPDRVWVLPPLWVLLNIAVGLYDIPANWHLTYDISMPDEVVTWVYADMTRAVVNLLWGGWLIGLALRRARAFLRAFALWQGANILWELGQLAFIAMSDVFVFTAHTVLWSGGYILVGLALIYLTRRSRQVAAGYVADGTARPPTGVYVINAVVGAVIGGALGAIGGFLLGGGIATVTDMSCFEGACGYFAALIGLLGLVVGVGTGIWLAIRFTGRRPSPGT